MIVEHECPQCGGPVTLEDTDSFLQCDFCRVRLCINTGGLPRYYIKPKHDPGEPPVLIPYWRIRGMYFTVAEPRSRSGTLDTSMLAAPALKFLPASLGLRTQTQRLKFAPPKLKASYIATRTSRENFMDKALTTSIAIDTFSGARKIHHRAYIGEAVSIIYAPYYRKARAIYDGVTMRPAARLNDRRLKSLQDLETRKKWTLAFTAAICPHCGWDLEGARDSVVFICRNCDRAWKTGGRRFRRVPIAIGMSGSPQATHMPFWRIEAKISGMKAATYADIIRLANLPKVVRPEFENDKFYYWFPATRQSPVSYKRIAKIVTLKRPKAFQTEEFGTAFGKARVMPVNLHEGEAAESIRLTLADLAMRKKSFYPVLRSLEIKTLNLTLVYLPFERVRNELIHRGMNLSIQHAALRSQ